MKKTYYTTFGIFAALMLAGPAAQAQDSKRNCQTNDVHERMMKEDAKYRANQASIENHAKAYTAAKANQKANEIITIPVYVHVLYNTAAENVSDAQIASQIAVLNADYAGTNADLSKLAATTFASNGAGDTGIRFELVSVTRKSTTKTSWGTADAMKKSSQGGVDPITPSTHMNMWVCTIGGGILGYAQFPGGAAATDGVVANSTCFGSGTGNVTAPFDLGRTMTHEVGHYLNLRHIWGDANCGDDFVADTPKAAAANYGCPAANFSSCSNINMTMNYMDYTDDKCMYMFSAGQDTRMAACLDRTAGARKLLGTVAGGGTGGGGTTPPATSYKAVSLTLTTDGYASESSWNVKNAAGTIVQQNGALANNTTYNVNFTLADGTYTFNMNDSYGDGMAPGTYTLKGDGTTFKSGSVFTTTEATTFTVSGAVVVTPPTSSTVTLFNNTALAGTKGAFTQRGSWAVPAGATNLVFDMKNTGTATGDADMYIKLGSAPTISSYGWRPYKSGNIENTTIAAPTAGTYYVAMNAYATYSGVTLKITYTANGKAFEQTVEFNEAAALKVFPNPASGSVNFSIGDLSKDVEFVTVNILDMSGKAVLTQKISANVGSADGSLDISNLKGGMYFVNIIGKDFKATEKLMVK